MFKFSHSVLSTFLLCMSLILFVDTHKTFEQYNIVGHTVFSEKVIPISPEGSLDYNLSYTIMRTSNMSLAYVLACLIIFIAFMVSINIGDGNVVIRNDVRAYTQGYFLFQLLAVVIFYFKVSNVPNLIAAEPVLPLIVALNTMFWVKASRADYVNDIIGISMGTRDGEGLYKYLRFHLFPPRQPFH